MIAMRCTRKVAVVVLSASLMLTFACIDFQHTNPFDPDTPLQVTIYPETVFSLGGRIQFTFATVPPLIDSIPLWPPPYAFGETELSYAGVFTPELAPLWPDVDTVEMMFEAGRWIDNFAKVHYRRTLYGTVVVTQRLVRIHSRCSGPPACSGLSVGAKTALFVDGYDALGSGLGGLGDSTSTLNLPLVKPMATFTVRDTSIATAVPLGLRVATVTGKAAGSTWIIAKRDSLVDSVQVVVH